MARILSTSYIHVHVHTRTVNVCAMLMISYVILTYAPYDWLKCNPRLQKKKSLPVRGTRTCTCGNRLVAWCDNGRLVLKYSCLNGRLIFTVSIQTVEFVNGRVVAVELSQSSYRSRVIAVELANDPLTAKTTTFPVFFFNAHSHAWILIITVNLFNY